MRLLLLAAVCAVLFGLTACPKDQSLSQDGQAVEVPAGGGGGDAAGGDASGGESSGG